MIVLKGTQMTLPPYFRCGKDIDWIYEFELPENGYDVGDATEQEDWLKLTGVKPKFFDPMYDSKMIGFRWNLENKEYEFCFYWHDKDKTKYFTGVQATSKSKITIKIKVHKNFISLTIGDTPIYSNTKQFLYSGELLYLINTFWGGTLNMQKTLTWSMKKVK